MRFPVVCVAILLLSVPAVAGEPTERLATALDGKEPRVEAALLALPPESGSGPLRIGVQLEMDPGWHIYARDPGETGLPTRVILSLSGQSLDPLHWPEPSEFREPDGPKSFGYTGKIAIWGETRARGGMARAEVELLACADRCIPTQFTLERALDADSAAEP